MEKCKINNDLTVEYNGKTYRLEETHKYDTCTGCPFHDTGCMVSPFEDSLVCREVYCASKTTPVFDLDECRFVEIPNKEDKDMNTAKLNLEEILKDCPKGAKLYSPLCGEVRFIEILSGTYTIKTEDIIDGGTITFDKYGRHYRNGECLLFPSKDNYDWSTFKVPNKLPKSWEEFCILNSDTTNDYYIDYTCSLIVTNGVFSNNRHTRDSGKDKCLLPNKETAEAFLALMQLIQLRDCYNEDWHPDWTDNDIKYIIQCNNNMIIKNIKYGEQSVLAFKTMEIRDEFFENFRGLIEVAKPLI